MSHSLSLLGLLLLLLLLLLIAVGIVTQSYKESFTSHIRNPIAPASPVMANLTDATEQTQRLRSSALPQINTLDRDADVINALNDQEKGRKACPVCKEQCPDMSKYIRRDSIPCWNCSL